MNRKVIRRIQRLHGRGRRQKGRGIMDFIGKAAGFMKKNKVLSRAGSSGLLGQYSGLASGLGSLFGMGRRRRRRCGRGLRLAGN
jgi:hypothetical protein